MKRVIKKTIIFAMTILAAGYMIQSKYNSNIEEVKSITHESRVDNELVLVNKKYGLDKKHIPEGLSIPDIPFSDEAIDEEKHVAGIMRKPLEDLVNEARKEGIYLFGNSGYRSYKSQVKIYNDRVRSQGRELADAYVAKPGFSEHQTGLCMDITNSDKFFVEGTV